MIHRFIHDCRACVAAIALAVPATVMGAQQGPEPASAPSVEAASGVQGSEGRALGLPREQFSKGVPAGTSAVADFARTALSLAGVVALAVLASIVLRTVARKAGGLGAAMGAGGRAPAGVMEVLGRYPIARGQTLVLLKLDRRVLLLSQSGRSPGGGMSCLCEISDPDEVASLLIKTRDAESASLASRFEESLDAAEREADRPELGDAEPIRSRRTTVSPAGDRVELLHEGGASRTVRESGRGYSAPNAKAAAPDVTANRPDVDAAAEVLRRRLQFLNDPKRGEP